LNEPVRTGVKERPEPEVAIWSSLMRALEHGNPWSEDAADVTGKLMQK